MAGHRQRTGRELQYSTRPIPTRRRAYGRRVDSCQLITDLGVCAWPADHFAGARPVPMPQGHGVRWLVRCPRCSQWRKTLYSIAGAGGERWCRVCWNLRYPSQYGGRRPEADVRRLEELLDAALRARSHAVGERRFERFVAAYKTYERHELAYQVRLVLDTARFCDAVEREANICTNER